MAGTTKQTPKQSQITAEINAHIGHVFTIVNAVYQLANNFRIVCFAKKCAKVMLV